MLKKIILSVSILNIFLLAFFAQPWADDFCNLAMMERLNPFSYAWHMYNYWDGRILHFFFQGISFYNLISIRITILFSTFSIFLLAYWFRKYLIGEKFLFKVDLWFISYFAIILWLSFKKHISETVYWATGGLYVVSCVIILCWFYLYSSKIVKNNFIWAIISFLAGAISFVTSPALLTYIIYPKLRDFFKQKKINVFLDKRFIVTFVALTLGTVFISIAPGNFIRSSIDQNSFTGNIIVNYIQISMKFMFYNWQVMPIIFLFVLSTKDFWLKCQHNFNADYLIKWVLVTISTVSPFAVLNSSASARASIHFNLFMIFIFIGASFLLIKKFELWPNKNFQKVFEAFIILVFLVISSRDVLNGYKFREDYYARLEQLGELRGQKVNFVFNRKIKEPRTLRMAVFSSLRNHWSNKCIAHYYDVGSVQFPQYFWGEGDLNKTDADLPVGETIQKHYLGVLIGE